MIEGNYHAQEAAMANTSSMLGANRPMPAHPIENAIERISHQVKAIEELSARLCMAADRLYGNVPQCDETCSDKPYNGDGIAGRLFTMTDALAEAVNRLAGNVARHDR